MQRGIFITFEGGDGAGKSTVITYLETYLKEMGRDVIVTREPGGIEISEEIRAIILNPKHKGMDSRTEALLLAAARRQHLVEKVIPNLEQGKVVLCDRFVDSSLAYQGYARGLGIDEVFTINQFAIENRLPDLTLYFDIEPEIGLARINANKEREVNRLDMESLKFHHLVREGYLELLKRFPNRIKRIDASHSLDNVFDEVKIIVAKNLE